MKKVLIVSPHFAPINAPDMQRVRLALPWLRENDWEPVVLAVSPDDVEGGVHDPLLEKTYPADIRVVRVRGVPARLTRRFGLGGLWLRCGRALTKAGDELLRREVFDLVFFSTTQFGAFTLGPRWKRRFGVPYVLDYQDPWVNDHYAKTGLPPPGGRIKHGISQWSARRNEPLVLRKADGVVAVSGAYARSLASRYPWFSEEGVRVIPFGASEGDIALARDHRPTRPLVPFGDGCFHHVYTGRGGEDLAPALRFLFQALRRYKKTDPENAARMRFHFIGTSYAPPPRGQPTILPVAEAEGVADLVREHCGRVPYFEALHYLAHADAILALGSSDRGYSASKLYPCLLARRPLLALVDHRSPMRTILEQTGGAVVVEHVDANETATSPDRLVSAWFAVGAEKLSRPLDEAGFAPFTARAMTRGLAACFDRALANHCR